MSTETATPDTTATVATAPAAHPNRASFLAKKIFYHKALPGKQLRYDSFKSNYYISNNGKYYCTVTRITDTAVHITYQLFDKRVEMFIPFTDMMF